MIFFPINKVNNNCKDSIMHVKSLASNNKFIIIKLTPLLLYSVSGFWLSDPNKCAPDYLIPTDASILAPDKSMLPFLTSYSSLPKEFTAFESLGNSQFMTMVEIKGSFKG